MKRESVGSSAIKSMGYNDEEEIVEVEIRESGKVYDYFHVPLEEYLKFKEAPSIGVYYNTVFKEKLVMITRK